MPANKPVTTDPVYADRRQVMGRFYLAAGVAMSLFIVVHYLQQCCFELSVVEFILSVIMVCCYWRIRRGMSMALADKVLMLSAMALFSALVMFESIESTGIYWVAGFPFVAYFAMPSREARYWVGFFTFEVFVIGTLKMVGVFDVFYSAAQVYCMGVVVLFYWVLAHIYKSQLELRQQQLDASYRRLEEQQHRMQVILDHSPVGIWMVDQNRHIQFLNKAWVAWSGISEEQARNADDYTALLSDELVEKSLISDQACLDDDAVHYFRESIPCADGKKRVFDMIKVRLNGPDSRARGLVGFAIDVTEKLEAEAEQRSLEHQIQHAQRLESLGVMAGGIAHDFNNLLTAIQGSVELAKLEPKLSDSMQTSLSCIDSAAQAAIELCRQMLAYSGKGAVKTETFYVRELIEEMRSLLDVSIGKNVSLEFHFDQEKVAINADRSQISQVLLNLIINASEAIGSGKHGEINVSVRRQELSEFGNGHFSGSELKPGCYSVLTVEDNGIGMDAGTVEHMFDPFFTTKFTGRGLGLSAILGILKAHHAAIEVDSAPGEGTSISVWFPCADSEVEREDEMSGILQERELTGRVLLVDDEPGVIQVAKRMLEKLGLDVVTAVNGREALDIFLSDNDFDWILLDVTMPEMDGIECLGRLRDIDPDIYVVLASGYNADSTIVPGEGSQPDDYLTKPFSFGTLRAVAERAGQVSDS